MVKLEQLGLLDHLGGLPPLSPDPGAHYGEVFTRRWVVELILDLVGYTADLDLGSKVIVEPSCGTGAFLLPVVDRLLESCARFERDVASLQGAVIAVDLLEANAERTRKSVVFKLQEAGLEEDKAVQLASAWVTTADFLLGDHRLGCADYVVGNPPYIRLESVPQRTMHEYRQRCRTMRGRSDIYVGFIERGLELLKNGGSLGIICADRWMRNQYGSDLREFVSASYAVDAVIAMHDVNAFEDDVSAYPAVVVLRNGPQQKSLVAEASARFGKTEAEILSTWARSSKERAPQIGGIHASMVAGWPKGRDLWPAGSPNMLALITHLEARYPPLEDGRTNTRIGIGVASGCDEVYLTTNGHLVEEDRLLPLLQASDTASGKAAWSGTYLVNPWDRNGLVDLARFPRLRNYLMENEVRLKNRHISRRRPAQWYRTIDRIDSQLLVREKLIIPDLKASAHPVLDEGRFYPHHNLYFIVSQGWDLEVLGGLLLSEVANLIVGAYCVKMRGGYYRFQAQYLRRIRVPELESVSKPDRKALAEAFQARDVDAATSVAMRLYGIEDLKPFLVARHRSHE